MVIRLVAGGLLLLLLRTRNLVGTRRCWWERIGSKSGGTPDVTGGLGVQVTNFQQ